MNRQFVHQIQTSLAWQVGLAAALLLFAFGVATAIVAQSRDAASTTPAVGVATGGAREGGFPADSVAPEQQLKQSNGATARAPEPAGAPSFGAGGTGADLPSLDAGRAIIRTGSVDLEVRSVVDAFEQVRVIATGAGGFVSDSTFMGGGKNQAARLTLRVPADRFGEVVTRLRELAVEVRAISTNSRDVTGETSDLEATLRNLRAVETQYAQLLSRANTIGDVLQVQERLNQVRLQIDRTEARRALLQSQTEMSTLSVSLQPLGAATQEGTGLRGAAAEAWQASLDTLEEIATAAVVVAVYSWWIVPLVVLAVVLLRRRWAHRATSEVPPPATAG